MIGNGCELEQALRRILLTNIYEASFLSTAAAAQEQLITGIVTKSLDADTLLRFTQQRRKG